MANLNNLVSNYLGEMRFSDLRQLVSNINGYNDSLDQFNVYENDENFFEMFYPEKPYEAVQAAYYGEYNYNDEYVRFNGYGNLESLSEWDLEREMSNSLDEIAQALIECYEHLQLDDAVLETCLSLECETELKEVNTDEFLEEYGNGQTILANFEELSQEDVKNILSEMDIEAMSVATDIDTVIDDISDLGETETDLYLVDNKYYIALYA